MESNPYHIFLLPRYASLHFKEPGANINAQRHSITLKLLQSTSLIRINGVTLLEDNAQLFVEQAVQDLLDGMNNIRLTRPTCRLVI